MDHEQLQPSSEEVSVSAPEPENEDGKESESETEIIIREPLPHPLPQEPAASGGSFPNFFGKHRLQAAITHLNDQITIIQEELEKLERIGKSSTDCNNVISTVESISDPLLPSTRGPVDAGWDRWFGGAHNSRNHKRWI